MIPQRWLRIIPVALVMYTISYVDRTNVSLALDPKISTMMHDLMMDDRMKGQAAGIFFLGYLLLQSSGGYLANRWSAKKLVSLCLMFWGVCAVGCGLAKTFWQFEVMRFLLGVAESSVFPAIVVLLAHWFPRSERAQANAAWNLCHRLAARCLRLANHADARRLLAIPLVAPLVVLYQRSPARGEMDFTGRAGIFGSHA